jgi:hypothetical protein
MRVTHETDSNDVEISAANQTACLAPRGGRDQTCCNAVNAFFRMLTITSETKTRRSSSSVVTPPLAQQSVA